MTPRTKADIGAIRARIARLGDRDDICRVADVVTVGEVEALCDMAEADRSLLLDAALRALVAAEDAIESLPAPSHLALGFDELQDALEDALGAARAALAATDVRGALAEALHQAGYEHGLRLPDHIPDWPDLADAILAALAAKGRTCVEPGCEKVAGAVLLRDDPASVERLAGALMAVHPTWPNITYALDEADAILAALAAKGVEG